MLKETLRTYKNRTVPLTRLFVLLALVLPLSAKSPAPVTFVMPADAVQSLVQAAESNDTAALMNLFGPDADDIVRSGDPRQDKEWRAEFARLAHEAIHIQPDAKNPDKVTFSIGRQSWPFPVPLLRTDGRWRFDSAEGRIEILAHRIGENESDAIEACHGFVEAQVDYASQDRDGTGALVYAQKIEASPGKHDGLYWEGAPDSLVSKSFSQTEGSKTPYHGYYFRILKAQGPDAPGGALDYVVGGKMIGGFAFVAWPAEYGVSGIQTFIVNHQGTVYQKDLGPTTASQANQITRFNPDSSWHAVAN